VRPETSPISIYSENHFKRPIGDAVIRSRHEADDERRHQRAPPSLSTASSTSDRPTMGCLSPAFKPNSTEHFVLRSEDKRRRSSFIELPARALAYLGRHLRGIKKQKSPPDADSRAQLQSPRAVTSPFSTLSSSWSSDGTAELDTRSVAEAAMNSPRPRQNTLRDASPSDVTRIEQQTTFVSPRVSTHSRVRTFSQGSPHPKALHDLTIISPNEVQSLPRRRGAWSRDRGGRTGPCGTPRGRRRGMSTVTWM